MESVSGCHTCLFCNEHDDVIKWKHFPCYWPCVRGIHRSPVNSPHKGQWRGALVFSLICAWINGRVNNSEAGDLRRHRAHYDVTVMVALQGQVLYIRGSRTWSSLCMLIITCSAPSHYLNQCSRTVNWILGNNSEWQFSQNATVFIQEIEFEIAVRSQYVNARV